MKRFTSFDDWLPTASVNAIRACQRRHRPQDLTAEAASYPQHSCPSRPSSPTSAAGSQVASNTFSDSGARKRLVDVWVGGEHFRVSWDVLASIAGSFFSDLYELHLSESADSGSTIELDGDACCFRVLLRALRLARTDLSGALTFLNEEASKPSSGPPLAELCRYLKLEWLIGSSMAPPPHEASIPASVSFLAMKESEGKAYGYGRHLDHASMHIGHQIPLHGLLEHFSMQQSQSRESSADQGMVGEWYLDIALNDFAGGATRLRIEESSDQLCLKWRLDKDDGAPTGIEVFGDLIQTAECKWELRLHDGQPPTALFSGSPQTCKVHLDADTGKPNQLFIFFQWGTQVDGAGVTYTSRCLYHADHKVDVPVLVQHIPSGCSVYRRRFHLLPCMGTAEAGTGPIIGNRASAVVDLGRGHAVKLEAVAILLSHIRDGESVGGMLTLHGLSELSSFQHIKAGQVSWQRVPANTIVQLAEQRFDRAKPRSWIYLRVPQGRQQWVRMLHFALHDPHCSPERMNWIFSDYAPSERDAFDQEFSHDHPPWAIDYLEIFGTYVEMPESAISEATPARHSFQFNDSPDEIYAPTSKRPV
eukprot:TRINITY_DN94385_c0_g1_i1.p1 TRINITY_DN94385_c0_g1~~TRINITY_DN94385_c0_g1_i1.p1  ORF type:complete len:609 (-),score=77.58 TRINITY_DN94385_c0_g1_i1:172-1941(-)